MRWPLVYLVVLSLAATLPALAEDWVTLDGKSYKNVTIVSEDDDGVRVTYDGGVGKLPYYELPLDVQKRLGKDMDALRAKKEAADKALNDAMNNSSALDQQKAQDAAQKAQQSAGGQIPGTTPGTSSAPGTAATTKTTSTPSTNSTQPTTTTTPGKTLLPGQNPGQASPGQTSGQASSGSGANGNPASSVKDPYPGGIYTYDSNADVCFLDSYPATATAERPENAPDNAPVPAPPGTLTLRIATDGSIPGMPAKIEVMYLASSAVKNPGDVRNIGIFINGLRAPVHDMADKDTSYSSSAGVMKVAFNLPLSQARSLITAKTAEFSIGEVTYQLDDAGMNSLRRYFALVDDLPPPPTSTAQMYHKFMVALPAIITFISTACEYIVLGSFGIIVLVSAAAFAMGVSRFFKM
jgi:hypothetical protein